MSDKNINATHYEAIPTRPTDAPKQSNVVHVIIETAKDSPHKYALKNDFGIIGFREVLPAGMRWPYDYGFITRTLAPDGDPLDVVVLTEHALFSGCLIEARVLGAVRLRKNKVENDRVIAAPLPSSGAPQASDDYREVADVPARQLAELTEFLKSYSEREGNNIEIRGVCGAAEAMELVRKAGKVYKKKRS